VGLVVATVYSIWMIFVTFFGLRATAKQVDDLRLHEQLMMAAMIVVIVWLGLFPQPVLDLARPAVQRIIAVATNGGAP
jgi:NADH-quinone oxidoreductase subunit M